MKYAQTFRMDEKDSIVLENLKKETGIPKSRLVSDALKAKYGDKYE